MGLKHSKKKLKVTHFLEKILLFFILQFNYYNLDSIFKSYPNRGFQRLLP